MDASNIDIRVSRPNIGNSGTEVFDNHTILISHSTSDVTISVEPRAINSETNNAAFYKVELELSEADKVEWVKIILYNQNAPVADPGPKVSISHPITKPTKSPVHPAKTQISQGIRPI